MPNNKIIDLDRLSRFKDKLDVELEKKANVDGNYPTMTVGSADSLTPYGENSGANDITPFVFQSTGGSSDVGNKAYLRELRGNSVGFNQLVPITNIASETVNGITYTNNGDGTWTISGTATADSYKAITRDLPQIKGHTILLRGCPSGGSSSTYMLENRCGGGTRFDYGEGRIQTLTENSYPLLITVKNGTVISTPLVFKPQYFDLTLFGKIYDSVLDFNRDYPKPYYAYNAGTLLSCKVNGIKNVGYNAYDNANPNDYIRVVAGQTYTLEGSGSVALYDYDKNLLSDTFVSESALPNSCCYVKITGGDSTTCFHLTWDGSRTGYEEYESKTYALPNIELRSAGSVYDTITPDGTLIRRVGSYTFTGSENWSATDGNNRYTLGVISSVVKKPNDASELANVLSINYLSANFNTYLNRTTDKIITISYSNGRICVYDTSIASASAMASAMAGKTIYFELAEPTTEQTTNTFQEVTDIDDWGTQEFVSEEAIPVPQGAEFFYPVDYKAFIDSLGGREDIEYDASQVVSQEQLQSALPTFLSSISGYDATKTQTLKNVSGVFQWVDD